MQPHFRHLCFNIFPMIWRTLQAIMFWPLKSLSKHSGIHKDSNSQHGSSLGSVKVLSFTLFCTLGGMRMWLSGLVLACTLASPFALVANPRLGSRHYGCFNSIVVSWKEIMPSQTPNNVSIFVLNIHNNMNSKISQIITITNVRTYCHVW
jgi:hypothetical protein